MPKPYKSYRALGEDYIRQYPELEGQDPEAIGRKAAPQLKDRGITVVEDFGDIDVGETLSNFPGDFVKTGGEVAEGIGQAISHPIDTAQGVWNLGTGGVSALALRGKDEDDDGLLATLGRGIATDEDRQGARDFVQQVGETLEPASIQQRPANALATLTDLIPYGPAAAKTLGTLARAGGRTGRIGKAVGAVAERADLLSPSRAVEAAAVLPFKAAKKAAGATKRGAGGLLSRIAKGTTEAAEDVRTTGTPLREEALANALGVTSGTSQRFIAELMNRRKDSRFVEVLRRVRKKPVAEAARDLQVVVLEAVNKLQERMSATFNAAIGKVDIGKTLDMAPIQKLIAAQLEEMKITIAKDGAMKMGGSELTKIGGGRMIVKGELRELMEVPQPTPQPDKMIATPADAHVVDQINRMTPQDDIPAAPNVKKASELHLRRGLLDEAISVLDPLVPISKKAHHVLVNTRKILADYLEDNLGAEYKAAMGDYRKSSVLRDNLQTNLSIEPGQLSKVGSETLIKGGTQEGVLRKIYGSFGSNDPTGATRLDALRQLENATGVDNIIPTAMAGVAKSWTGGGLIVRNEIAQMGRLAFAGTAFSMAGLSALPAFVLFSPRLISEAIIRLGPTVAAASRLADRGGKMTKSARAKFNASSLKISKKMEELDALTGGQLRARAQREGWNIAQLMERMDVQLEEEERE